MSPTGGKCKLAAGREALNNKYIFGRVVEVFVVVVDETKYMCVNGERMREGINGRKRCSCYLFVCLYIVVYGESICFARLWEKSGKYLLDGRRVHGTQQCQKIGGSVGREIEEVNVGRRKISA